MIDLKKIAMFLWDRHRRQKQSAERSVYFMRDPDTGSIKIGKAKNPEQRLRTFQTANPNIEILATVPGYTKLENQLHRKFADSRIFHNREWFHPAPEILDYIRNSSFKIKQRPMPRRTIFGRVVGWWNHQLDDLLFWSVIVGGILLYLVSIIFY